MEEELEDGDKTGNSDSSSKKGGKPVKFYIDDHDDGEEKEKLIDPAPAIVVDPPSEKSPERDSTVDVKV